MQKAHRADDVEALVALTYAGVKFIATPLMQ